MVAFPLFSGYCFARFSLGDKGAVVRATGIIEIVGTAGVPEPVGEREIGSLQALVRSRFEYDPHPGLVEGRAVEVIRGQGASVEVAAGDVTPM